MHDQYYTFTMFDAQACYARDYIMGKIDIKTREERTKDMEMWRAGFDTCKRDGKKEIVFQRDYVADLLKYCDYPEHNHAERAEQLKEWKGHRENNITTYRDQCFTSVMTGDVGVKPIIPWMKNMDDSLERYVNTSPA